MPFKNTAHVVTILVWDTLNGVGKTGQSANLTLRGVGDGAEFTPSSPSITEVDSTNLKGIYSVSLTAGENNYTNVLLGGICSTTGCVIQPIAWTNEADANLTKIAGVAVSTSTAQLGVNVVNFGGSAGTFSSGKPTVLIASGQLAIKKNTALSNFTLMMTDSATHAPITGLTVT